MEGERRLLISSTKSSGFARIQLIVVFFLALAVAFLVMYFASFDDFGPPTLRLSSFYRFISVPLPSSPRPLRVGVERLNEDYELRKLLDTASMADDTVILTALNEAWAGPNSVFDYFLRSFKVGNNTEWLLKHILVICYDEKAYARCQAALSHCYLFRSKHSIELVHEATFMSPVYIDMTWERLAFLHVVLSMGYNFVFTDNDVMWLRDPFPYFLPDVDIQTSCDRFNGREFDWHNYPNNGFSFVRSSNRTIELYRYWIASRVKFPPEKFKPMHEQDIFNKLKYDPFVKQLGLKMRFLDTDYFGGFCRPSKDFNKVCTMHANCCAGVDNKVVDLNTTLLDWKRFMKKGIAKWRVPRRCRTSIAKLRKEQAKSQNQTQTQTHAEALIT